LTKKLVKEGLELWKVTGGEPTACKYFMGLLDWIIDNNYANGLEIQLTTNGTKFNKPLIQKLLKFKKVKLLLSIDGTGKVYDYIRHNASWPKVYANLKSLTEYPTIDLMVALVASFYNTTNIADLIHQCAKLGIPVYTDQDLKPENSEISPYNTDSNIRNILNTQATQLEKEYTTDSLVDHHARQSAKALRSIATAETVGSKVKKKLLHTLQLQDRLYNTNYVDFLQTEQIEYLGTIDA
jgi:sulfatase maturation enzyme AslB (radical SAM superfamily)